MYRDYRQHILDSYNMACPGNRLRWDLKKEDFPKRAEQLMTETKAVYDAVGALKKEEVNYDNIIKVCNTRTCKAVSRLCRPIGYSQ